MKKNREPSREKLIYLCRYYHGQEKNPYEGKNPELESLWFYESSWVTHMEHGIDSEYAETLGEYLIEYINAGLRNFRDTDQIPISLKAFIFNRFMRGSMDGDTEPFKKFFNKYY